MNKLLALLLLVGVVAAFPTKNFNRTPEVFWFTGDDGKVLPALLHGKRPSDGLKPTAIEDDVQFYLFNSKDLVTEIEIKLDCASCLDTFVKGAPTLIFAHGFSASYDSGTGTELRDNAAQAPEVMNIILVNWAKLAAAPWYETAANNVKPVGQYIARLVEHLVNTGATPISNIIFAGHSLGAHMGNAISQGLPLPLRLPIVHALDPALPLFGERTDDERIDPSDAEFVNVIHASMGTLLDGGLAFTEPRGHADFYPNSGAHQPGCGTDYFGACSHSRAHQYFGESIHRRNAFIACECPSWEEYLGSCDCSSVPVMGWATPTNTRGVFYLKTHASPPYGIGTI